MKKIYSFTLDSDEYPSIRRNIYNDLRIIAYILYKEIYNYYGYEDCPLNINPLIEYNNLNEEKGTLFSYKFDSDKCDDGYTYYEPFIVGNKTFCFTIVDNNFDDKIISECLEYVMNLLRLNYKVIINKYEYNAKDINDERYREDTIRRIFNEFGYKCTIKTGLVAMIMKYNSMKKRIRSNKRKSYSYY